jgi:hypothetical protein
VGAVSGPVGIRAGRARRIASGVRVGEWVQALGRELPGGLRVGRGPGGGAVGREGGPLGAGLAACQGVGRAGELGLAPVGGSQSLGFAQRTMSPILSHNCLTQA